MTATAALAELAPARDAAPADAIRFSDFTDRARCLRAMAAHLEVEPDIDRRGQSAYLVNRLANSVGDALATIDLTGGDPSLLRPADVAYRTERREGEEDGEPYVWLHHDVWLADCPRAETPPWPSAMERMIVRLFRPVVAAASAAGPLAPAALWRLVADGVAASYLNLGKAAGDEMTAMRRAEAILRRPRSPLDNAQLRFVRLAATAEETPSGRGCADWFRLRGGCCRWYTVPDGGYCGTCVLRKDREDWIRAAMIRRATAM